MALDMHCLEIFTLKTENGTKPKRFLLEKGAALQSTDAMFLLGKCYVDGTFDGNTDYRVAQSG